MLMSTPLRVYRDDTAILSGARRSLPIGSTKQQDAGFIADTIDTYRNAYAPALSCLEGMDCNARFGINVISSSSLDCCDERPACSQNRSTTSRALRRLIWIGRIMAGTGQSGGWCASDNGTGMQHRGTCEKELHEINRTRAQGSNAVWSARRRKIVEKSKKEEGLSKGGEG